MRSILFVCAGNLCRSPIAEALFRQIAASRPALSAIEVGSAGTFALDGDGAVQEAIDIAREAFDLDISGHRARNVARLEADLILTMDGSVTRAVNRLQPNGRVELLGEYAGTGEIVADPYGRSPEAFLSCARQLQRLIHAVADRLQREVRPEGRESSGEE
ncbi:MAG TPA: hypothetical protein VLD67_03360 [Vicinamibacterales bacterium]|nr:hypothetical protein [Vicinamibacterales bacterium]